MQKLIYFRRYCVLVFLCLALSGNLFAQEKKIVFVYDTTTAQVDPDVGGNPDLFLVDMFIEEGYEVETFPIFDITTASQDQLDALNGADLVYIGRAVASSNFETPKKEVWNSIEAPIMTANMWALRNTRMNWFNTANSSTQGDAGTIQAEIIEDDPVFDDAGLNAIADWWTGGYDIIDIGVDQAGNGTVMAVEMNTNKVCFVRFEADEEFYEGSVDMPAGERVFFGFASDGAGVNYWGYVDPLEEVFFNEVARLTGKDDVSVEKPGMIKEIGLYQSFGELVVGMEQLAKVEIIDIAGTRIYSNIAADNKLTINLNDVKSGIYIIKATDANNNIVVKKFIKK